MQRIWLLNLALISGISLRAADAGKDWGVEREFYADPVTGVRVQELTKGPAASDNLYYHVSNFTADNRYLIFVSDRGGSWQLFRAEVETGKLAQLTDHPDTSAPPPPSRPHPTPRGLPPRRGREFFGLNIPVFTKQKGGKTPKPRAGG